MESAVVMGHSDIVYATLVRRDPAAASEHGRRLAELWGDELSRVISRVFAIGSEEGRTAWHIDARTELIFEMAQLLQWLADRLIAHRLKDRTLLEVDVVIESAALNGPEGIERIENTAQIVARQIWNRIYDELHKKYPLVQRAGENTDVRLPGRAPRERPPPTHRNHYIPQFTVRPWADAEGNVREYRRLRNGTIRSRRRPYSRWGFEKFLYPRRLEEYFQRVETRAADPYKKIVQCLPLTPADRYFWISFLILQYVRTPSFMAAIAAGLRHQIISKGWPYPTTPDAMRRLYLTLFDDDHLFAAYYRRLDGLRWHLLVPPTPMSFPRTDAPIVLTRDVAEGSWRALYSLSPDRCLQLGPERAEPEDVPFALAETLNGESTLALNRLLLGRARCSAVVPTADDPRLWWAALRGAFSAATDDYRAWGPLRADAT